MFGRIYKSELNNDVQERMQRNRHIWNVPQISYDLNQFPDERKNSLPRRLEL